MVIVKFLATVTYSMARVVRRNYTEIRRECKTTNPITPQVAWATACFAATVRSVAY